jgi:hypothetical protein
LTFFGYYQRILNWGAHEHFRAQEGSGKGPNYVRGSISMSFSELVISKAILDENNRAGIIDYFVTKGTSLTDGAEGIPVFGICVRLSVDGECFDNSAINDVSPSKETTMRMIQLFAKNLVTPVSIKDVVEDCLAAQL